MLTCSNDIRPCHVGEDAEFSDSLVWPRKLKELVAKIPKIILCRKIWPYEYSVFGPRLILLECLLSSGDAQYVAFKADYAKVFKRG